MEFDYSKLIGRIKEKFNNRNEFAKLIKLSSNSLSKKLNNKVAFTSTEIYRILNVLDIDIKEVSLYFYVPKVEKVQQN